MSQTTHTDSNILFRLIQGAKDDCVWQGAYRTWRLPFVTFFIKNYQLEAGQAGLLLEKTFANLLLAKEEWQLQAPLKRALFAELLLLGKQLCELSLPEYIPVKDLEDKLKTTGKYLDGEALLLLIKEREDVVFDTVCEGYQKDMEAIFNYRYGFTGENMLELFGHSTLALRENIRQEKVRPPMTTTLFNYFLKIAQNSFLNFERGKKKDKVYFPSNERDFEREPEDEDDDLIPQILGATDTDSTVELVESLMKAMGERCRSILAWKFWDKMPVREMAERLELTETNVRVSTHRCLEQMHKLLLERVKI